MNTMNRETNQTSQNVDNVDPIRNIQTMKTTTISIMLALSGLAGLGAGVVQASDHTYGEVTLQFSLIAQQQVIDTNYHASVRMVRIGTKDILRMLGEALTNDLTGYNLKLRSDMMVQYQFVLTTDGDGPEFDVTQYFTISWGEEIWKGTADPFYGPIGTGSCVLALGFNDGNGHSFTVQGLATERASSSSKPMYTVVESNSWRMKAAGEGSIDGNFAVVQGTVSASGRWEDSYWPW